MRQEGGPVLQAAQEAVRWLNFQSFVVIRHWLNSILRISHDIVLPITVKINENIDFPFKNGHFFLDLLVIIII